MRRGLLISFFLHIFVGILAFISVPDAFFPKNEIQTISIKLVAATDVKKTTKVEQPKTVNTQQSAAPKAPAKPQEKPKPKPKDQPKKPTVVQEVAQKSPTPKKPEPAPQPKKEEPKQPEKADDSRPAKLDKTPDKKNIIQDKTAEKAPPKEDDFLKALSFIEDLKASESAMFEGETTEKTTINIVEQAELAIIKKHIERNWYKTPGTQFINPLLLRMKLNRDGTLASLEVIESSGSSSLDNSLMRAVRKAVPLPIPAEKYDQFKEIDLYWNG